MEKLNQLKSEYGEKLKALHALSDKLLERAFNAEEKTASDTLKAEIKALEERISGLQETEDQKKRAAANSAPVTFDAPGADKFSKSDKKSLANYSVSRAVNAQIKKVKLDGLEAEVQAEANKERDLSGASFNESGTYIPSWLIQIGDKKRAVTIGTEGTDIMQPDFGELIPVLAPQPLIEKLGVTIRTGLRGDYQLPRVSGAPAYSWQTEAGASSATTPTFDNIKLTPKRVSSYVDWTNQSQIQSKFNMEQELRDLMNQFLTLEMDKQTLVGDGSSNKPTGILYTSGVGSVSNGTNGGALTWAKVVEFFKTIEIANAPLASLAYAATPSVKAALMTTPRQTSGVEGNFIMPTSTDLAGYSFLSSNQLPSTLTKGSGTALSAMIFGNFSECYLGMFGGLNIIYDNVTQAGSGTQRLYFEQFLDVKLRHAASFAVAVDIVA